MLPIDNENLREEQERLVSPGISDEAATTTQITTCTQLQDINQNLRGNYELARDIDCSDTRNWNNGAGFLPIGGFPHNPFRGQFSGHSHVILNLYINQPLRLHQMDSLGLFGKVIGANTRITSVGLVNANITGETMYMGTLIGRINDGIVSDVFATGTVNRFGTGGLSTHIGGLIGFTWASISDSYADVRVSDSLSGYRTINAAGFAGVSTGYVTHSHAKGDVVISSGTGAGFVGFNGGNIFNSYATGNVENTGWIIAGGFVGRNFRNITSCYSVGKVTGNMTGGLVGKVESPSQITSSYYDVNTSGQSDTDKGEPKTTLQMRQYQTFSNWSFGHPWKIQQDCDYPFLSWQDQKFAIEFVKIPSPQRINAPFPVLLYTNNRRTFKASLAFYSERGQVLPLSASFVNGEWSGDIMLYETGKANRLGVRWFSEHGFCSDTSVSNFFDVVQQDGELPNNARVIGRVVDKKDTPISNATVTLFVEQPDKADKPSGISTLTDEHGYYAIPKLTPTKLYLQVEKDGYQTSVSTVDTAMNRKVTGNVEIVPTCTQKASDAKKIPVLLVAGIMGSTKKDGFTIIPELPHDPPAWNSGKLELLDPLGTVYVLGINQGRVGWRVLKDKLVNNGYCEGEEGRTLFDVPYDWSLPIPQIRDDYLIPWINKSREETGSPQVIIVAHSMGGLVARSYIQSDQYQGDVRFLVMAATPNKGADNVYFIWEGGDPNSADRLLQHHWYDPAKNFYTETLNKLWTKRGKKDKGDPDKLCKPKDEKCYDDWLAYNFVHNKAQSAGQLVPIYEGALIDKHTGEPRDLIFEENTFLKALNNLTCLSDKAKRCLDSDGAPYQFNPPAEVLSNSHVPGKVETQLIYGLGEKKTVSQIRVLGPGYYPLYQDGVPPGGTTRTKGDGTVIPDSVKLSDYFPPGQEPPAEPESAAKHANIIRKSAGFIASLISERNPKTKAKLTSKVDTAVDNTPVLAVTIDGRVQVNIADPGHVSTKKMMGLEQAQIVLINMTASTYVFPLTSLYRESYALSVIYYSGDGAAMMTEAVGYYDESLDYIKLTVNPRHLTTPLQYDRVFDIPTDVQLYNNSDQTVALRWEDKVGDARSDVTHYTVFYRPYYDPYLHVLGESIGNRKIFETDHSWEESQNNIYHVRSVLNNHRGTFLSGTTPPPKPIEPPSLTRQADNTTQPSRGNGWRMDIASGFIGFGIGALTLLGWLGCAAYVKQGRHGLHLLKSLLICGVPLGSNDPTSDEASTGLLLTDAAPIFRMYKPIRDLTPSFSASGTMLLSEPTQTTSTSVSQPFWHRAYHWVRSCWHSAADTPAPVTERGLVMYKKQKTNRSHTLNCEPITIAGEETLACESPNATVFVFQHESSKAVTPFSEHEPSQAGDQFKPENCRPIVFDGKDAAACEGESTTAVYIPQANATEQFFDQLSGNAALAACLIHGVRQLFGGAEEEESEQFEEAASAEVIQDYTQRIENEFYRAHGLLTGEKQDKWLALQYQEQHEKFLTIKHSDFITQQQLEDLLANAEHLTGTIVSNDSHSLQKHDTRDSQSFWQNRAQYALPSTERSNGQQLAASSGLLQLRCS